jgi:SAM-dependent methyltransferase
MLAGVTGVDDHVLRNRAAWDQRAAGYAAAGLRSWSAAEPGWGIWGIAEAQAGVLPPDLRGLDVIELGCGTGYVSAWLARRGARPVALDNSPAQLATARELQERFGLRFPLVHADAERAPFADAVEFHLGHGDMIRLLRRCGLEVEDLLELHPEPGSVPAHPLATLDWARQWPCEEVWKARKSRHDGPRGRNA